MRVTITFDNGPEPEVTPQVLDCLAQHNVKSTFFVVGRKVSSAKGLAISRRARAEGHRIGNHTFTHTTPLGYLDRGAALLEFEEAEQALGWLDQPQRLFRPFGRAGEMGRHLLHPAVVEKLTAGRYTCVLWNCVPGDWANPKGWLQIALAGCRSQPWSLVVLHDLPTGAMLQLDHFIRCLKDGGVELTQDYPPECVPIVDGEIVHSIDAYVAAVS